MLLRITDYEICRYDHVFILTEEYIYIFREGDYVGKAKTSRGACRIIKRYFNFDEFEYYDALCEHLDDCRKHINEYGVNIKIKD